MEDLVVAIRFAADDVDLAIVDAQASAATESIASLFVWHCLSSFCSQSALVCCMMVSTLMSEMHAVPVLSEFGVQ
jgi:hypothetical protein